MEPALYQTDRAWIEVNVKNLQHNVEVLKKAMSPGCELMAVVKAEAYGHGAFEISSYLNRMGVRAFAVATIEEGIKLRKSNIYGEILILGYTNVNRASELKNYDLTQTLIDFEYAKALDKQRIAVKTHIKIDTGMHRWGIPYSEVSKVKQVFSMKSLHVCGIFTHLSCSDSKLPDDRAFTRRQIDGFYYLISALKGSGIKIPKLHIQSSYGLFHYPELTCDYARVGIALYGVLSSPNKDIPFDLRPVLSLKSRVVLIREVDKGSRIGYGRSFVAGRNSRIAVLPIGYGDGFPRNLSCGKCWVWIHSHLLPVIGCICMDSLVVDITDAKDVVVGNIATLIGEDGTDSLSAPFLAERLGSISNELLCRMGARLPVVVK